MTRGTGSRAEARGPLRRSDQGTEAQGAAGAAAKAHAGQAHEHGHDHAAVAPDADHRYISAALGLILAYMVAEVVIGIAARSLALISDAGHMLTDAAALALALAAMSLAARPAQGRWTFGFKRAEILSAQANGITLLVLVAVFTYEAIRRLVSPPDVRGGLVIGTALAGIAVNAAAAWLVGRANRTSLNVEGAFQHILNDAWAFVATAAAGVVVLTTGFARADALASLVVAALMAHAGFKLVRESWRIFLEAAPEGLEPAAIGTAMAADPEIAEVHDLHVWTITSGFPALSAHVLVTPGHDCHAVQGRMQRLLHEQFGIEHTTLQVDHAPEALLTIGRAASVGEAEHSRAQDARPRGGAAQDRDEPETGPGAQHGAH
ncbi:MAG TPA: cation diffusion facilitator family transporter [Actinocrinis sp.]|jgi:cobalt-zinc-cadmium efflux system protein